MNFPKTKINRGIVIKGRFLGLVGINIDPELWMIFDEPENYNRDEQDKKCKTYYYHSKLHALTIFQRLIKAYKQSKKQSYVYPIKLRGLKT